MRTFVITFVLFIAAAGGANAQFQTTQILAPGGAQFNANTGYGELSAGGRYYAFTSPANNLVPNDMNNAADIFVYDLELNTFVRASTLPGGAELSDFSGAPDVSDNGRFVVFTTPTPGIVPNDNDGDYDIFLRDLAADTIECATLGADGGQVDGWSGFSRVSGDGRFVAFVSSKAGLVAGDTNEMSDVFLYDRTTKKTVRVSVASDGTEANNHSTGPYLSSDGTIILFTSFSDNLVPNDTNQAIDVFVHNRKTGATRLLSAAPGGAAADGVSYGESISSNGRYVGFSSFAKNIEGADGSGMQNAYIIDTVSMQVWRASVADDESPGDATSALPRVSDDGRFVTFASSASNLVSNDTNGEWDVFLRDRLLGTTVKLTNAFGGGDADDATSLFTTSANGLVTIIAAKATNIAEVDLNNATDHFIIRHPYAVGGSLEVAIERGWLIMNPKLLKDSFYYKGTFTYDGSTGDGQADPTLESTTIQFGNGAAPEMIHIPAGHARWKALPNGRYRYSGSNPSGPGTLYILLDAQKRTILLRLTRFQFGAAPSNPIEMSLQFGADGGVRASPWTVKKALPLRMEFP